MESGARVRTDSKNILEIIRSYKGFIGDLSGSWEGDSYDKFNGEAESFIGECSSITSGMDSFATACETYSKYLEQKEMLKEIESALAIARKNNETNTVLYELGQKTTCEANIIALEALIKSSLDSACKSTITEATAVTISAGEVPDISIAPVDVTSLGIVAPGDDSLYVSTNCGYVFPIAKGIYAPVTSSVGPRSQPTAGASTNHKGTDIAVDSGTEVHSLYDGEVIAAGYNGGYGNRIVIRQTDGREVTYAHLSKSNYYKVGDKVRAGDVIAKSGNTGVTTGPHLHLEIHDKDGTVLNSENLFSDKNSWPGNNA